jgi:hypothetical protein
MCGTAGDHRRCHERHPKPFSPKFRPGALRPAVRLAYSRKGLSQFSVYNRNGMDKLTAEQVAEYLDKHVPYRLGVLLAHYRMTRAPWRGDPTILNACFIASLVTARVFLNMLGVGKRRDRSALMPIRDRDTDVLAHDLGGKLINPATLPSDEQRLLLDFLKMADQAAAHFTTPIAHDWTKTHDVIRHVHSYLKANLYDATGRTIEPL